MPDPETRPPDAALSVPAALLRAALLITALGAVFASVSEFWFYEITPDTSGPGVILAYGLIGYLIYTLLWRFPPAGLPPLVVAAGLFGFLVEGVPVPMLYLELPLSVAWTPLAWHALLTVLGGWFLWRRVMSGGGWPARIALNLGIGVFVGLWGAYSWNAVETLEGLRYDWRPVGAFATQMGLSALVFAAGHGVLDLAARSLEAPLKAELPVLAGLAALIFGLGWLGPLFPLSLLLPVLAALSVWAIVRGQGGWTWWQAELTRRVGGAALAAVALIPAAAVPVYALIHAMGWEWETNAPVALVTVPVGAGLWLWALWRCVRA